MALIFSSGLVDQLKKTLAASEQAMLFLNCQGFAPLTLCRTCLLNLGRWGRMQGRGLAPYFGLGNHGKFLGGISSQKSE